MICAQMKFFTIYMLLICSLILSSNNLKIAAESKTEIKKIVTLNTKKKSSKRLRLISTLKNGRKILSLPPLNNNIDLLFVDNVVNLNGDTIIVPNNISLFFDGGCLINGHVVLNNTRLTGDFDGILCECSGSVSGEVLIDYFGVSPHNEACQNSHNIKNIHLSDFCYKFGSGTYEFDAPIEIRKDCEYVGESRRATILKFNKSDGFVVTEKINDAVDFVSSRADFRNLKIDSYGNCFDLYSSKSANDERKSKGLSYSTFENLILQSKRANGFYSTTPSRTTYANMFKNILFSNPNGACFNNTNLYLCTRIENCADLGSKFFFYNCFFRQTYIESCNLGFGNKSSHIYYNDKMGIICDQTAKFVCCNFEEQNSNLFVNLHKNTTCSFRFENCNFNMGDENKSVNGAYVYLVAAKDKWEIEKVKYDAVEHRGRFAPCVGYGLYFNFDETCDFSWYNVTDGKKFPSVVSTFSMNEKLMKRMCCPSDQRYIIYIEGKGEMQLIESEICVVM